MADASGTTTYTYDTRDRLTTKATPEGTLSYSYDAASDVKTIQSSNAGGADMAYGYDALDRLASVTDANGATSYTYDPVGNLGTVTYPNGVAHSYTYDTRNRLTNLAVAKAATAIASYGYTLDAAWHRTSVTELSGRTVNYSYDSIYRLTSETIASDPNAVNGAIAYTYDAVGNRKQMTSTVPGLPAGLWNYDANDRFTMGDTYDADGNTVSSGVIANIYDFENRLVQQGGLSVIYDGDGNRVSKTTANGTTQYLVDNQNPTGYAQVMDEVQSSAVVRTYSWGLELISQALPAGSPLATGHSPLSYYVLDGHGSVRALTNATGAVTDTYDYDAFGNLLHSTGTTPNNYLFAGEQFDPDLHLYYDRARYLNTSTGRFWTMDSFEGDDESPLSLHKYLYTESDPIGGVDPSGNDDIAELFAGFELSSTLSNMSTVQTNWFGPPTYQILKQQVTKNPFEGFFKEFKVRIDGTAAAVRFLVVQWLRGSIEITGKAGMLSHQSLNRVPFDFFNWQVDSFSSIAEYPGVPGASSLVKSANSITLYDAPGLHTSLAGIGRIPGGVLLKANVDFRVNVYDARAVPNEVSSFKSVDDPKPLLSIPWDFHDSYAVR